MMNLGALGNCTWIELTESNCRRSSTSETGADSGDEGGTAMRLRLLRARIASNTESSREKPGIVVL
jgi:hypothetical protein